jgi:hypothetical protein
MIRNSIFALATVALVTAAASAPASAHWKGGRGFGWGVGLAGIAITSAAVASCYQWVESRRYGWVRVNTCY